MEIGKQVERFAEGVALGILPAYVFRAEIDPVVENIVKFINGIIGG